MHRQMPKNGLVGFLWKLALVIAIVGWGTGDAQARLDVLPAIPPPVTDETPVFDRITLEMSLKPFRSMEPEAVRAVCTKLFQQWAPLIHRAKGSAVMLWTSDGSEILDYQGRLDDEIEWAQYIGIGNPTAQALRSGPQGKSLHELPWLYMENPPHVTYGSLRLIVTTLKEVGQTLTGKPVTVGATFDPGPEFAFSAFKYRRHPEIAMGDTMGSKQWVSCTARLKADTHPYAGFPKGIPEGTSMGTFLGRQSQHFLRDLGFDYLWLSNGFGFSLNAWDVKGVLFDGKNFDAAKAGAAREEILSFWREFRKECPDIPLETRGSNLSTGADLSSGASPLADIYHGGFKMAPPPNSPWAALDGDYGLELVGYLSHIADLPPAEKFPFRFYTHDPWWLNSPWFDRYGREPHDIYLPLALARINGHAEVKPPASFNVLTVDDSFGRMPDACPLEVIPHVLTAMRDYSDEPGLLTWIYPFNENHELVFGPAPRLAEPFFGDWFMRNAVNAGLSLNSVVSTENFLSSLKKNAAFFRHTMLLSRVPDAGSPLEAALVDCVKRGHQVLLYGPLAHGGKPLLDLLNLKAAAPLSGELKLTTTLTGDAYQQGTVATTLNHREVLSAGGVDAVLVLSEQPGCKVGATVSNGQQERVYAVAVDQPLGAGSGRIAWVRGSFSCSIGGAHLPVPDDPRKFFPSELLMRWMLGGFGYDFHWDKPTPQTRNPLVLVARSDNGFFFSGYCPSTAVKLRLRFPQGAPLLTGCETVLEAGHATYCMPRAWHHEARCFIQQQADGEVSCVERYSGQVGIERRLKLGGLKNATVNFYPPAHAHGKKVIMVGNGWHGQTEKSLPYEVTDDGRCLTIRNVTGQLLVSW